MLSGAGGGTTADEKPRGQGALRKSLGVERKSIASISHDQILRILDVAQ